MGGRTYLVQYDREGCIGAGSCVAANADFWSMNDDGKADLKDGAVDAGTGFLVREIPEEQLEKMREAARSCPVAIIRILDKQTGKPVL